MITTLILCFISALAGFLAGIANANSKKIAAIKAAAETFKK